MRFSWHRHHTKLTFPQGMTLEALIFRASCRLTSFPPDVISPLQADHLRFFTSNHSRPVAAAIKMTITLHGVDEVGSSANGSSFAASDGLAFVGGKEGLGAVGTAVLIGVVVAP